MPTDALLAETDIEAAISHAYVTAVAAAAGYVTAKQDFDRDGVDLQIRAGGHVRPSLDLQLKATKALPSSLRYPLKVRNYNLLREPCMVPRILVVLELPRERAAWVSVTSEELVLKRCAYWLSLADMPHTDNTETVSLSLIETQRFDVRALRDLMEKARSGAIR